MKYDVFISHSSADLELSETIYDYLQEQGIKCWIDSRNVTGHNKEELKRIYNHDMILTLDELKRAK